ncbi:MAG: GNAT family N-acetyltransferase [Actinomycetes bacterium]|jgi:ribosomal protein S18 acetylase RimI-like enzyme
MTDLMIREAQLEDVPRIAQVHVETWRDAYLGIIPDTYLQSLSIDKRAEIWEINLRNQHPKSHTLVAELDGQIVGFIGVGACRDEESTTSHGEVFSIYVDSDKQGLGIGTRMLNQGLEFLKNENFSRASLWVLAGNESSRFWYESRGWRRDGKVKSEHRGDFDLIEIRYVLHF